jgi:ABC-2 type transport system ATP-binding protein
MSAPALQVRSLTRTFASGLWRRGRQTVTALAGLTFDVAPGEIAGLLGPNGAGKTTLLEILATLLLPSSGTVAIDGADLVAEAPRVRRRLAYCPAGASTFFPRLTGRRNLEVFLALAGVPPSSVPLRIAEAADRTSLADDLDRELRTYSDGMRQRLSIARALAIDATLWLFDEPTRSLDPAGQHDLRASIRELAAAREATVILATHDLVEAEALCDRVLLLRAGSLRASGSPAEIATRHGSLGAAYAAAIGGAS